MGMMMRRVDLAFKSFRVVRSQKTEDRIGTIEIEIAIGIEIVLLLLLPFDFDPDPDFDPG